VISGVTSSPITINVPIELSGAQEMLVIVTDIIGCEIMNYINCPPPTPTMTMTPTITPTRAIINCNCIAFTNVGTGSLNFGYTRCDGTTFNGTIPQSTTLYFCGRLPFADANVTISISDVCVNNSCQTSEITPTPTPTNTTTPTPTIGFCLGNCYTAEAYISPTDWLRASGNTNPLLNNLVQAGYNSCDGIFTTTTYTTPGYQYNPIVCLTGATEVLFVRYFENDVLVNTSLSTLNTSIYCCGSLPPTPTPTMTQTPTPTPTSPILYYVHPLSIGYENNFTVCSDNFQSITGFTSNVVISQEDTIYTNPELTDVLIGGLLFYKNLNGGNYIRVRDAGTVSLIGSCI
jgi:hypothetical protein